MTMFPALVNVTNIAPVPTALVATPLPDSAALRVPFDVAPPPVSSAQVNNNARGNNSYIAVENGPGLPVPVANPDAGPASRAAAIASAPVSATFLAQLIAQNVPTALQGTFNGLLSEYEKIVANSFIKFKPSFASLPQAQPSNSFESLLKQQAPAEAVPVTPRAQTPEAPPPATSAPPRAPEAAIVLPQPVRVSKEERREIPKSASAYAASAYKSTADRADVFAKETARRAG